MGKSALSSFNQSVGVEPLAAQTKCTLSPFDPPMKRIVIKLESPPGAKCFVKEMGENWIPLPTFFKKVKMVLNKLGGRKEDFGWRAGSDVRVLE